MCKKHKKKIHLRQICGFHLNLFMAPLSPKPTKCAKIDVPIEWVTISPIFRLQLWPGRDGKGYSNALVPFYWFCGQKKWAGTFSTPISQIPAPAIRAI